MNTHHRCISAQVGRFGTYFFSKTVKELNKETYKSHPIIGWEDSFIKVGKGVKKVAIFILSRIKW